MVVKKVKCTICGFKQSKRPTGKILVCESCGSEFVADAGIKLGLIDDSITNKIAYARSLQQQAIRANNVTDIAEVCGDILRIVVGDYLSLYFYAYSKNKLGESSFIKAFYEIKPEGYTIGVIATILKHIRECGDLSYNSNIKRFIRNIEGIDNQKELDNLAESIESRKGSTRDQENYEERIGSNPKYAKVKSNKQSEKKKRRTLMDFMRQANKGEQKKIMLIMIAMLVAVISMIIGVVSVSVTGKSLENDNVSETITQEVHQYYDVEN